MNWLVMVFSTARYHLSISSQRPPPLQSIHDPEYQNTHLFIREYHAWITFYQISTSRTIFDGQRHSAVSLL
jgi:hypothetical protein